MKRHGNLYDRIIAVDNLLLAFDKARRHKSNRKKIQKVLPRKEELCNQLHDLLKAGTYKTSQYNHKTIYEPKKRLIYILPFFPDRVLHHAVMNVLEPIWDGILISDSYACRKGKGQHAGSRRCMEFVRRFKYCLKCDVSKFYPSVNHAILKVVLRKKIKDERLLKLLDEIINSAEGDTNVPIGNFLSQWFGNIYLNELDMFAKHVLREKAYIRYCDDFIFFSNDKQRLHEVAKAVTDFADSKLALCLSKCDVFPTAHGVDFLGYRHFSNGVVLVRKSTAKRMKRRLKRIVGAVESGRVTKEKAVAQIGSAMGWIQHANAHNLAIALKINEKKEALDALV